MTHEILYRPTAAALAVRLEVDEAVRAESGTMVAMSPEVRLEARAGGLRKVVGRLLAGESALQNRFVGPGEVLLAPALPGDVQGIELREDAYLVTSGAFLAGSDSLEVNARTRLKDFLVGERLFMLRVSGSGLLFVNAFGAIHAVELPPAERLSVDTGHLVAWSDTMDVRTGRASRSYLASAISGEGIVATLTGPGVIYMQTRAPQALGAHLRPFLPKSR